MPLLIAMRHAKAVDRMQAEDGLAASEVTLDNVRETDHLARQRAADLIQAAAA